MEFEDRLKRLLEEKYFNKTKEYEDVNKKTAYNELEKNKNSFLRDLIHTIHRDLTRVATRISDGIYQHWYQRERHESKYRKKITIILLSIFFLQVVAVNIIAILIAKEYLYMNSYLIMAYFSTFVVQLIGIVVIIIKYFYNERSTKSLSIVGEILTATNRNNSKMYEEMRKSEH